MSAEDAPATAPWLHPVVTSDTCNPFERWEVTHVRSAGETHGWLPVWKFDMNAPLSCVMCIIAIAVCARRPSAISSQCSDRADGCPVVHARQAAALPIHTLRRTRVLRQVRYASDVPLSPLGVDRRFDRQPRSSRRDATGNALGDRKSGALADHGRRAATQADRG
jgi:hypothetical protein